MILLDLLGLGAAVIVLFAVPEPDGHGIDSASGMPTILLMRSRAVNFHSSPVVSGPWMSRS